MTLAGVADVTVSAAEQYLLELMNRARLDPLAEAARLGIALNDGLATGTISGRAKQVLAGNDLLNGAATAHSAWMLENNIFSHTGEDGSQPDDRMSAAGFPATTFGENIALVGSTAPMTIEGSIEALYENLFLSAEHRIETMREAFREVGLGAELGSFTQDATTFNAVALTENFGVLGTQRFLTGVAYQDGDADNFYSIGEGIAGVKFLAQGGQADTASAGGYAIGLSSGAAVAVTGQMGALAFALKVDMRPGNVKLDLVNGTVFFSSGSLTLGTGVHDVVLLGVADLKATGSAEDNAMTGNDGDNALSGLAGRDVLSGGAGDDILTGGRGNDRLIGGGGADAFVFGAGGGKDRIAGFSLTAQDELHLNDTLWNQTPLTKSQVISQFATVVGGEVVFDFGADELHLGGLISTDGLAALILIL